MNTEHKGGGSGRGGGGGGELVGGGVGEEGEGGVITSVSHFDDAQSLDLKIRQENHAEIQHPQAVADKANST